MNPRQQGRIPIMPALDGIRAVAILAVLLFHIWPAALGGGYTGVDVFFVLSGFLIASVILADLRADSFSMREFYLRRIQRLLPNIVVTVLAVVLLWTLLLPPSSARQAGAHGLWTVLNLSNFYVWRNLGSYWGNAAEWSPLTHTWSLGVEEQFYLVFPGALVLLARLRPKDAAFGLALFAVLSFGLCLWGTYTHPAATFYLLPTRAWELLVGAALAACRTPLRGQRNWLWTKAGAVVVESLGWVGLGLIAIGFVSATDVRSFPGAASLLPTAGAALLILSTADGTTGLSAVLSGWFLGGIGRLSFSLYLWHWPLIILGKTLANLHGLPEPAGAVAGGACGVLLAWGAYVAVERPLRERGPGRPRRLAIIATGFSAAVLCCGFIAHRRLVADPAHRFDTPEFYFGLYDAGRNAGLEQAAASVPYYDVHFPPLPARQDDLWRTGGILHLYGGGRPAVVVLGSSHALMYSKLVDDICRSMGLSVAFLGVGAGTPAFFSGMVNDDFPSKDDARQFDDARRRWLREWRPEAVLVIDRWDIRLGTRQAFARDLHSFLAEVCPLAGRVIFVAQVPVLRWGDVNPREYIAWQMGSARGLPRMLADANELYRDASVAVADGEMAEFANLRVLRADAPFYEPDRSVRYAAGRSFFYVDDNHLSAAGAEETRDLFQRAIAEAHGNAPSR